MFSKLVMSEGQTTSWTSDVDFSNEVQGIRRGALKALTVDIWGERHIFKNFLGVMFECSMSSKLWHILELLMADSISDGNLEAALETFSWLCGTYQLSIMVEIAIANVLR